MTTEMPIEQARASLGDLVIAAMRGESTTITRYGKPVAEIGPPPEPVALAMNKAELDVISEALIRLRYELYDAHKTTTNLEEKNRIRLRIEDTEAITGRMNDLFHRGEVTPPGYRED